VSCCREACEKYRKTQYSGMVFQNASGGLFYKPQLTRCSPHEVLKQKEKMLRAAKTGTKQCLVAHPPNHQHVSPQTCSLHSIHRMQPPQTRSNNGLNIQVSHQRLVARTIVTGWNLSP